MATVVSKVVVETRNGHRIEKIAEAFEIAGGRTKNVITYRVMKVARIVKDRLGPIEEAQAIADAQRVASNRQPGRQLSDGRWPFFGHVSRVF